jgi:hypothetical protein
VEEAVVILSVLLAVRNRMCALPSQPVVAADLPLSIVLDVVLR